MNSLTRQASKEKTICLQFDEKDYDKLVEDPKEYRAYLNLMIAKYPELLPEAIKDGYQMKDKYLTLLEITRNFDGVPANIRVMIDKFFDPIFICSDFFASLQ